MSVTEQHDQTAVSACPGCGVVLPVRDGPTHAYLGSSPACWAVYGEVLAREYGDPEYARVHQLRSTPTQFSIRVSPSGARSSPSQCIS